MVTKTSNKSISLEFSANAYVEEGKRYFAIVRGKKVSYEAHDINHALELHPPAVWDVERRMLQINWPSTNEEWDELIAGLMKEGKGWRRKTPTTLLKGSTLLTCYRLTGLGHHSSTPQWKVPLLLQR